MAWIIILTNRFKLEQMNAPLFLGSEPWGSNILHRLQWIKLLSDKDAQIECLSAQVKSTAQLQARGRFTLILGLELCSLFKILL